MNLILFETFEVGQPLLRSDARAMHVLDVLRRVPGDTFDIGVVNGPRGKGTLQAIRESTLELGFVWGPPLPPPAPVCLIVGLPRPQTARKVLQEATTFGVAELHFVATERGEPQYAQSTLWSSGEWRRHLLAGAAQAFDTRLPSVTWGLTLEAVLVAAHPALGADGMPDPSTTSGRIALDNYEASSRLGACRFSAGEPIVLAVGPERGWGPRDRDHLREHGFVLAHLGERVLRAETASLAALAIVAAQSGSM